MEGDKDTGQKEDNRGQEDKQGGGHTDNNHLGGVKKGGMGCQRQRGTKNERRGGQKKTKKERRGIKKGRKQLMGKRKGGQRRRKALDRKEKMPRTWGQRATHHTGTELSHPPWCRQGCCGRSQTWGPPCPWTVGPQLMPPSTHRAQESPTQPNQQNKQKTMAAALNYEHNKLNQLPSRKQTPPQPRHTATLAPYFPGHGRSWKRPRATQSPEATEVPSLWDPGMPLSDRDKCPGASTHWVRDGHSTTDRTMLQDRKMLSHQQEERRGQAPSHCTGGHQHRHPTGPQTLPSAPGHPVHAGPFVGQAPAPETPEQRGKGEGKMWGEISPKHMWTPMTTTSAFYLFSLTFFTRPQLGLNGLWNTEGRT